MDNNSARSRKKGNLRRRPQALIFVVALILFAFVAGGIYGKYVQQANGDGIVTADAFYFESDVLDEPNAYGEYPKYELAAGTTSITFSLDNFADDLLTEPETVTVDVEQTPEASDQKTQQKGPKQPKKKWWETLKESFSTEKMFNEDNQA